MTTAPSRAVKIGAFVVVAASILALFGAAEALIRFRADKRAGYGRVSDLYVIDPALNKVRLAPNVKTEKLSTNAIGFRGPLPERPKPAGMFRMVFLGSSTTVCHETSDAKTWPNLVWEKLSATGAKADYFNCSAGGWTVADVTKAWRHYGSTFQPDIVLIYEGTNDLSIDARTAAIAQGLDGGSGDQPDAKSWLSRHSLLADLVEKNLKIMLRQAQAVSTEGKVKFDPAELSLPFKGRVVQLVNEVKESGALPVLITFAPRVREEQTPEEQSAAMVSAAYYTPFLGADGTIRGFDGFNARLREVAAETGAVLIDDIAAIPGDAVHYTDSVHFTEAGAEKMADRVVKGLLASPEVQARISAMR